MNRAKALTLAIALLSALALTGLAYEQVVPPNFSALLVAVVAGMYGIVRSLQKIKAGADLKSLLATTEVWGAILTNIAAIATSAAGVVSPKTAVAASVVATGATYLARALQRGTLPPVAPAVLVFAIIGSLGGCHGVKPDQALADVVDCAKVNPENSAAVQSIFACLYGLGEKDSTACMEGLLTDGRWAAAEIKCVAAYITTQTTSAPAQRAALWLSQRRTVTVNLTKTAP
jgi:hypothetical protein